MKKLLIALSLGALFALPAQADSNFGVKGGPMSVEGTKSDALEIGFVYTADIWGMFGLEFDALTSASKGEATSTVDYGITQFGGYGVFMTPGPVYLKAKAGYAYTDPDVPGGTASSDVAYGVGVGFELFGVACEVEYTLSKAESSDIEFASFAIKF